MLSFHFSGADGIMTEEETLTTGMVGKEVRLEFTRDWDGLSKTAVFMAGGVTRDVVGVSDVAVIPAEVLAVPMKRLYVGVYGVSAEGKVTPTIRAAGPEIQPGIDPSGDAGTDPKLPVWAQLQQQVDELKEGGAGETAPQERLTFQGAVEAVYDGSAAVSITIPEPVTDAHINDLIQNSLGVIEHGAY